MSAFTISASYKKSENSSELKPTINNTITVHGPYGTSSASGASTPPEQIARAQTAPLITPELSIPEAETEPVHTIARTFDTLDLDTNSPFERRLLSILLAVISSQDKTLLLNVIDQSGDLILALDDLKQLIKIVTNASVITIATTPMTIKCGCSDLLSGKKVPLWSSIDSIICDGEDFEIAFNKYYHKMRAYKISLDKVIE